jgi:hypothetical protein
MILGIVLATIASFAFSAVLYALPPVSRLIQGSSTPRPGVPVGVQMALVILRSLITAGMVAALMVAAGWHGAGAGAVLGCALIPLPAVLLLGGVIHEATPIRVASVHLLDWVAKLVIIGALVGAFL